MEVFAAKGDATGTKSQVDTVYNSCGCTPIGKISGLKITGKREGCGGTTSKPLPARTIG
jgi:hypothetical protein